LTLRGYQKDIDETIKELDLDLNDIKKFQETHNLEALYHLTTPLYIKLRIKGYKHYPDLTG